VVLAMAVALEGGVAAPVVLVVRRVVAVKGVAQQQQRHPTCPADPNPHCCLQQRTEWQMP
jgi:hypothetical protein